MSSRRLIIAIDGPSGAGKGTVARALALALDYQHVDTGGMYRAVAWKAMREGVDLGLEDAIAAIARAATFELSHGKVGIDGHDVTTAIRTPEMDAAAASVARLPKVRAALVERQRAYGQDGGVVMEGRDIGTVVFPAADVKLFLDASPEERARRRSQDPSHTASRVTAGVAVVAEALAARDQSDRTRTASPLAKAEDALYLDTTGLTIDQVVARALEAVEGQRAKGKGQR
jgi:cytidylate kinase